MAGIDGLALLDTDALSGVANGGFDPYKLTVDVGGLGMTGFEVGERLRSDHGVNVLLADRRRITAMLAPADDRDRLSRLVRALEAVAAIPAHNADRSVEMPPLEDFQLELAMLPRDAYFGDTDQVPADDAVGRICAEMISPYPPGIPVILPGERINEPVVRYLTTGAAAGFLIPDAIDPQMETIRVVAE